MKTERKEALMRIVVGIISGIIISLWGALVKFVEIIHWFYAIFTAKRSKTLGDFCNKWNTQMYRYLRYMTFATNMRVFPFKELGQDIEPYDSLKER